jgi:hypothetical protein
METLENFRINFLLYLPVGVPAYLIGSLTFDYFLINHPAKIPGFMQKGNVAYQQIEAKNGNVIPLLVLRLLTAIASVTSASLLLAIYNSFLSFQTF